MKRISVWLSEVQIKRLRQVSKRTGLKMAELIRRFIDEGLRKQK
jgi:predicted DNA-binding protein